MSQDQDTYPIDQWLQQKLHRWNCPTPDQLADFQMQLLSEEEASKVSAHISTCPRCQQDMADFTEFMESDDEATQQARPTLSVLPRAKRPLEIHPTPQVSGAFAARGLHQEGLLMLSASGISVFLEIRRAGEQHFLEGRIADDDLNRWTDAVVELRQQGVLNSASVVDTMGGFVCHLPNTDPFDLRITSINGLSIVLEQIT